MGSLTNEKSPVAQPVRLIIVQSSELNCEALTGLFRTRRDFVTVWSGTSLPNGVEACRQRRTDVVLFEAIHHGTTTLPTAEDLIRGSYARGAMLLDDLDTTCRTLTAVGHPLIAYFTRHAGFESLCAGVRALAEGRRPVHPTRPSRSADSASTGSLSRYANGQIDGHSPRSAVASRLARLTPRETEVMRLIAMGKTVKDCATILQLAQSTVDNHKTRLMKKLDIHKACDLTRLAIREGLISA